MTRSKGRRTSQPANRPGPASKKKSPGFDELIVDRSLPRVKVRVFPSRKKSKAKPDDQLVIELQCEV
jgi:hypothetical protein